MASELERLWAEHGRRASDICELLEHLADVSSESAEPRPIANQPLLAHLRDSGQAAPAPRLRLVGGQVLPENERFVSATGSPVRPPA
jgi:hypothetical protein